MEIKKCVAERIKSLLAEKKLSIKEFSDLTALSCTTVKRLLAEKNDNLRFGTIYKIVVAFNLSFDELFEKHTKK